MAEAPGYREDGRLADGIRRVVRGSIPSYRRLPPDRGGHLPVRICREPSPDSLRDGEHSWHDVQVDVTAGLSYIASLVDPGVWWGLNKVRRTVSGEREEELD